MNVYKIILKKYSLLAIAGILMISCKTKNITDKSVTTNTSVSSTTAFYKKIKESPSFQQIKITSRINADTGSFIPTLDATIYIENGKKVWINLIAIILNVGRGIATPEGIKGYEKWDKTYIESDFGYLNNLLNINFIDFAALQNLLIGKTFIPINEKDFVLTQNQKGYHIISSKNLTFANNGKISEYIVSIDYSADFDLIKVYLKDKKSSDELEISYENWVVFENIKLPKNVKIIIKGSKTSHILLENTKFESSKMETPYSVPNNYTKTEIR